MDFNISIFFLTGFIPFAVRAIWFHPRVCGHYWARYSGMVEGQAPTNNRLVTFAVTYLFHLLIAFTLATLCIHQMGVMQVMLEQPGFGDSQAAVTKYFEDFMARYGDVHRDWKHGALHGGFAAFTFALPMIGGLALTEGKGWKYICIHFGYWLVSMTLMGAVITHFL